MKATHMHAPPAEVSMTPIKEVSFQEVSNEGHRARLKAKFLSAQGAGLSDYELLEIILFLALPRRDVRPLARELLARFECLTAIFQAPAEVLLKIPGLGESGVTTLKTVACITQRLGREEMRRAPLMTNLAALEHYCQLTMGQLGHEQLRVFYLDAAGQLLVDHVHQSGGPHSVGADVRALLKDAVLLDAHQMILVHNHPSGDATPSGEDLVLTVQLQKASDAVGVYLYDHLILGRDGLVSLRSLGHFSG